MEIQGKSDATQIWAVLGTRENVDSLRVFWNKGFLAFKVSTFFGVN